MEKRNPWSNLERKQAILKIFSTLHQRRGGRKCPQGQDLRGNGRWGTWRGRGLEARAGGEARCKSEAKIDLLTIVVITCIMPIGVWRLRMITIRKSADRGHFNHGWLDTH